MVMTLFQVWNKNRKFCFFEKTFLLTNICINIAFEIFFFILSNIEVIFNNGKLIWRQHIATKTFFTIKQVQLIRKKELATIALDSKNQTFIVYIVSFMIFDEIYLSRKTQIDSLKIDQAFITILLKNFDFPDIFFPELAMELSKHTEIKNYTKDQIDRNQLT